MSDPVGHLKEGGLGHVLRHVLLLLSGEDLSECQLVSRLWNDCVSTEIFNSETGNKLFEEKLERQMWSLEGGRRSEILLDGVKFRSEGRSREIRTCWVRHGKIILHAYRAKTKQFVLYIFAIRSLHIMLEYASDKVENLSISDIFWCEEDVVCFWIMWNSHALKTTKENTYVTYILVNVSTCEVVQRYESYRQSFPQMDLHVLRTGDESQRNSFLREFGEGLHVRKLFWPLHPNDVFADALGYTLVTIFEDNYWIIIVYGSKMRIVTRRTLNAGMDPLGSIAFSYPMAIFNDTYRYMILNLEDEESSPMVQLSIPSGTERHYLRECEYILKNSTIIYAMIVKDSDCSVTGHLIKVNPAKYSKRTKAIQRDSDVLENWLIRTDSRTILPEYKKTSKFMLNMTKSHLIYLTLNQNSNDVVTLHSAAF